MKMRGACVGLQKTVYLPGHRVYEYPYTPENFPWFYDRDLWIRYLDLLARNWCQVKYSDAIFAIGRIKNGVVQGGTAWAVQMAIDAHKPVYLFDQASERWLTCRDLWLPCDVPVLTHNFAGIGSRDISNAGICAIGEVYRNTFKI